MISAARRDTPRDELLDTLHELRCVIQVQAVTGASHSHLPRLRQHDRQPLERIA
jgi:hypothetical protein